MKILKYFKSSRQNFIIWIFAFLFLLTSFILSFFNLCEVVENSSETTTLISGVDLFFGSNFNAFSLISWILMLGAIITAILSVIFKKIQVLQGFLLLISLLIFAFLPQIVNSPLPENPEVTRYLSIEYTTELIILIVLSSISLLMFLSLNVESIKFSTREISELAMLIGLAIVLNFFPKIPLQWAGSINFQIVPLIIIALRFSPTKTFVSCGFIFGLVTCLTDGYGLFAFPLEYLVAFGSVAIISPFRKFILKIREKEEKNLYIWQILSLIGLIALQTTIRFACASIDSYIFYYAYLDISTAGSGVLATMIYNAPYVFLTGVATIGVICALYYPLLRINKRYSNN